MKKIQIFGPGCHRCEKLAENAEIAVKALGLEYEIEKVTDMQEVMSLGVVMTPALVVDGTVKIVGKVADIDEIKKLLS